MSETATVSARAIQAEFTLTQWDWVGRIVWMERMLAALGNGVKGSKWSCCWPNAHFAEVGAFHDNRSLDVGEPIPMRKPQSGEPNAGEPHVRFGGRGGREPFSTPIKEYLLLVEPLLSG